MTTTDFDEPTFTGKIRDEFLDLAGRMISQHGAHQLGISRRGKPNDFDRARLAIFIDQDPPRALERMFAFESNGFCLPTLSPACRESLGKIKIATAFTTQTNETEATGVIGEDGLRFWVGVHIESTSPSAGDADTGELSILHRTIKAWAHTILQPSLGWLRTVAATAPHNYGFQMLASPHQIKENVTYEKALWWNE